MIYKKGFHSYKDCDLIGVSKIAESLGVSRMAINKAERNGRIDTFENSNGKKCYHKIITKRQFVEKKNRSKITTPNTAQKKAGFDNLTAQSVAHSSLYDNPLNEELKQVLELGSEINAERQDLETSRAEKEFQMARIAKLKADEMEGRLVDKTLLFNKAYQIGSEIQDKITTMYSIVTPNIIACIQDTFITNGFEKNKVQDIMQNMVHPIGELIRSECIKALRTLSDKTEENILD